jgi:hypothetical protein
MIDKINRIRRIGRKNKVNRVSSINKIGKIGISRKGVKAIMEMEMDIIIKKSPACSWTLSHGYLIVNY